MCNNCLAKMERALNLSWKTGTENIHVGFSTICGFMPPLGAWEHIPMVGDGSTVYFLSLHSSDSPNSRR